MESNLDDVIFGVVVEVILLKEAIHAWQEHRGIYPHFLDKRLEFVENQDYQRIFAEYLLQTLCTQ
jgi:hypothetical protein